MVFYYSKKFLSLMLTFNFFSLRNIFFFLIKIYRPNFFLPYRAFFCIFKQHTNFAIFFLLFEIKHIFLLKFSLLFFLEGMSSYDVIYNGTCLLFCIDVLCLMLIFIFQLRKQPVWLQTVEQSYTVTTLHVA